MYQGFQSLLAALSNKHQQKLRHLANSHQQILSLPFRNYSLSYCLKNTYKIQKRFFDRENNNLMSSLQYFVDIGISYEISQDSLFLPKLGLSLMRGTN